MPDTDGIEALRLIRQQIPDKIVIAQTAHEWSHEIAAEEFDDFLQKPIRRKMLIETLSKYLLYMEFNLTSAFKPTGDQPEADCATG